MFFFAGEDVEIVFLQVKRSLDDIFVHHLQAVEATIFCNHDIAYVHSKKPLWMGPGYVIVSIR